MKENISLSSDGSRMTMIRPGSLPSRYDVGGRNFVLVEVIAGVDGMHFGNYSKI